MFCFVNSENVITQEIYQTHSNNESSIKMLKIQMLEQILNNDENINEDGKSQVSTIDGREPSHDDQFHGYFVQNGSTFNG